MCQQLGGFRLAEIMRQFGLSNIGSVSFITTQIRKKIKESKEFATVIQRVKRQLYHKTRTLPLCLERQKSTSIMRPT